MTVERILFALLAQQICGKPLTPEVRAVLTPENRQRLFKIASVHDLGHLVGQALEAAGITEDMEDFRQLMQRGVFRYISLDHAYTQACALLEAEKIPFIPLKGSVLRAYYPEPWMRASCDIDILVRDSDFPAAKKLLEEKQGYREKEHTDHDSSFLSPGGVCLELHYDTITERYADDAKLRILGRIWETARPVQPGGYRHEMPDDMFYFYHMAHMAKHFETGGCGIRPFLDIWVLNHRVAFDKPAREALLTEGGLTAFARGMENVTAYWLENEEADRLSLQVTDFILRGGVFGTYENRAAVGQAKSGGGLRYFITQRLFAPYDALKCDYPILREYKILMPVYQVVRWVNMFRRGELRARMAEAKTNAGTTRESRDGAAQMLKELEV